MFFLTTGQRARWERNRRKAQALIRNRGAGATDFVREQIAGAQDEPRNRAHWQRVERHLKALLAAK